MKSGFDVKAWSNSEVPRAGGDNVVNYGYGPGDKGWKEEKISDLAEGLDGLLGLYQKEFERRGEKWPFPPPEVEVNRLYRGVRLRKLTHLGEAAIDELCVLADQVYSKVMGLPNDKPENWEHNPAKWYECLWGKCPHASFSTSAVKVGRTAYRGER